jgi:hypothetical protein
LDFFLYTIQYCFVRHPSQMNFIHKKNKSDQCELKFVLLTLSTNELNVILLIYSNVVEYPNPHQNHKLDPDPEPHQSDKLDPDPHQLADDKPKCMEYEPISALFQGFEPSSGS